MVEIEKQTLKLVLPLPTSVNMIYGRNKFGSTYLKKEGKEYKSSLKKYLNNEVKIQGWEKLNQFEYCYLDSIVVFDKLGRDADNIYKLIQDCITECNNVWYDDTFVWSRTNRVYINKNNPRVEITISKSENVGIFDNKQDFDCFEDKCKACPRYRNGRCSILVEATKNKINESLQFVNDKWNCTSFKTKINK